MKAFQIQNKHGGQWTRSFDETSFVVAYVNCVLKVNANEVFPDQDYVEQYLLGFDKRNFTENPCNADC